MRPKGQHFQMWVSTDQYKVGDRVLKISYLYEKMLPSETPGGKSSRHCQTAGGGPGCLESSTHSINMCSLRRMTLMVGGQDWVKASNSPIPRNYHLALGLMIYLWNFLTITVSEWKCNSQKSSCPWAAAHSDASSLIIHLYISHLALLCHLVPQWPYTSSSQSQRACPQERSCLILALVGPH